MANKAKESQILLFEDLGAVEKAAELFIIIHQLYNENKELLMGLQASSPPALTDFFEKLLLLNKIEQDVIKRWWKKVAPLINGARAPQ